MWEAGKSMPYLLPHLRQLTVPQDQMLPLPSTPFRRTLFEESTEQIQNRAAEGASSGSKGRSPTLRGVLSEECN
jgi:hypothetical protein